MRPPIPEIDSRPDLPNPIVQAGLWLKARPLVFLGLLILAYFAGCLHAKFQRVQAVIFTEPQLMIYRDKDTGKIHIKQ